MNDAEEQLRREVALFRYALWRDNQDEKRATIRMRINVATRPRMP